MNFRAPVRDSTLSQFYPAQQYMHARSHHGGTTGEVSQSISNNVIKSPPASPPYARIVLTDWIYVLALWFLLCAW